MNGLSVLKTISIFIHFQGPSWQGWQKSGKYSYFPGQQEILGNKIDSFKICKYNGTGNF